MHRLDEKALAIGADQPFILAPAKGDRAGQAQSTRNARRSPAVGIEKMRVYHGCVEPALKFSDASFAASPHEPAVVSLGYSGKRQPSRPMNLDSIHPFESRHCGTETPAEQPDDPVERRPRLRRHHDDRNVSADAEHPLPNERARRRRIDPRKQAGKDDQAWGGQAMRAAWMIRRQRSAVRVGSRSMITRRAATRISRCVHFCSSRRHSRLPTDHVHEYPVIV